MGITRERERVRMCVCMCVCVKERKKKERIVSKRFDGRRPLGETSGHRTVEIFTWTRQG